MGIAGESGCGKTTLGKSLIRLDGRMRVIEGTVELDGTQLPLSDDNAMNAFRFREVSIIPQYAMSALNPIRKIGRMTSELLASRGVSYDETLPELSRRLALVGLDDTVLDRYPIELSGGMKQRVVMVLSTLLNPSLLIADELTSALDVSTQKAVAEMLVEFRDREFVKSTIVITHDLSILYQMADTILIMYAGQARREGVRDRDHAGPAPSLHPAPARLAARGRGALRRQAAERHPRPAALAPQPADGLPVPRALPARVREVRRGAAVRRDRAESPRRLLEGGRLMLEVAEVTKVFKTGMFGRTELTAVSNVSFVVRPGEVISLIGESGSGKTTVGRMILRLTGTTAGAIKFDGRDVASLGRRDLRRYYAHVQGVFQDPFSSYNPVYKVDRVLGMMRASYLPELSAADWKVKLRKSLEAVSLEPADVLGKYPHQLSGGQLQRLMIARALLLDLKFLVADEIISMLDASTRIDVLNLLGDLKERGVGILFITHDLSLGNYISDTTLILRRGRIVEMGATEKVYGKPAHPYTQMLLTSVPHLTERWDAGAHAPVMAGEGTRRTATRR